MQFDPTTHLIRLQLTDDQFEQLKPLYEIATDAANTGKPGMLIAQVFGDGILCGFVETETAKQLSTALGSDPTREVQSAFDYKSAAAGGTPK